MYMCAYRLPPARNEIVVPIGEEYGGVSDRITIIPWHLAVKTLNVTAWLVDAPYVDYGNLETLLDTYYAAMSIKVLYTHRVSFLVRRSTGDSSTWSIGNKGIDPFVEARGLLVKYPSEYKRAQVTCRAENCGDTLTTCFGSHHF
jgi:hypothetical protein